MGWSRSRDGGRTWCLGTTGPFSTQTPLARMKDAARGARPTHTSLSPRWKSDFVAGIVAQPASASTAAVIFSPLCLVSHQFITGADGTVLTVKSKQ